jgi:Leucine-rich repeat (LRR) protein
MTSSPTKIYQNFVNNTISKSNAISLISILLENVDDEKIRTSCIHVLENIDGKDDNLFEILENLIVSDPNDIIRKEAVSVIKERFSDKAAAPLLWAISQENSFNCIITILNSLHDLTNDNAKGKLISYLKKVELLNDAQISDIVRKNPSVTDLLAILINLFTVSYLIRKFPLLQYEIEDGLVRKLDFSRINKKILTWKDREAIKDLSEIHGIKHLRKLKELKLFPLKWSFTNDYNLRCQLELIQTIKLFSPEISKFIFISEIRWISSALPIKSLYPLDFELQSSSKLGDFLLNLFVINYLKKCYPHLKYELSKGEVKSLNFEKIKLVSLKNCLKYLSSLKSLNLKNTSLYRLPKFISNLTNIEYLNLEQNNLSVIPCGICSLSSLKYLNLNHNKLKVLPITFDSMKNINFLSIDHNFLNLSVNNTLI